MATKLESGLVLFHSFFKHVKRKKSFGHAKTLSLVSLGKEK